MTDRWFSSPKSILRQVITQQARERISTSSNARAQSEHHKITLQGGNEGRVLGRSGVVRLRAAAGPDRSSAPEQPTYQSSQSTRVPEQPTTGVVFLGCTKSGETRLIGRSSRRRSCSPGQFHQNFTRQNIFLEYIRELCCQKYSEYTMLFHNAEQYSENTYSILSAFV